MKDKVRNTFKNVEVPLEEAFKWKVVDEPGKFMSIGKARLLIDHTYQREKVCNARVLKISSEWSWVAFGVLTVAQRPSGEYWVIDGQHRKLAADKRTSVDKLPCLVFETEAVEEEAEGFLQANTLRGPVSSYDKYRCKLACKHSAAVIVQKMVEAEGYRVLRGGIEHHGVGCVSLLMRSVELDRSIAERTWSLAVKVAAGEHVVQDLYAALFHLEKKLSRCGLSICDRYNSDKLVAAGQADVLKRIRDLKIALGKGGAAVSAQAVILLLNKNRKANRLPNYSNAMPGGD